MHSWASTGGKIEGFFIIKMRTISELERQNATLIRLNKRLKDQLEEALNQIVRNHAEKTQAAIENKKRGEFHHPAFEQLCPAPDLSQITIFK